MGKCIQALLESSDQASYIGPVFDQNHQINEGALNTADVIIDFSTPKATQAILAHSRKPVLIGTTGHSESFSAKHPIPVLYAPNTSLGIHLVKRLLTHIGGSLKGADISIVETHHNQKKDKPSGTALSLKQTLSDSGLHADVHSVRGGGVFGEHDVRICWQNESISINHQAFSRNLFASGAIHAALWLANQKPGFYTMEDVFA